MPNLQEWLLLVQSVFLLMLAWMLVAANRQALRLRSDIDSLLWLARKLIATCTTREVGPKADSGKSMLSTTEEEK